MAEAYGKLTGRPGVCMVTRGPGATNASIGVHTAMQDSTPLLLLIGQVARGTAGARRSRRWTSSACSGASRSGSAEIDDPGASRSSWPAPFDSDVGPSRAGRPLAARGHARRDERRRRRGARTAGAAHPGRSRPGPVARAAGHGRASARDRRRQWLDAESAADLRRSRKQRDARRRLVSLSGRRRQPLASLLRRRRPGDQPGARAAGAGRRSDARARHAPGRVDDRGLHVPRLRRPSSGSSTFTRGRASSAACTGRPGDRLGPAGARAAARALGPVEGRRWAGGPTRPAPTTWLTRLRTGPGTVDMGDDARVPARPAAGGCRSSRTAPATSRSGRTASSASAATAPSSRRSRARWATACRPRSPRRSCTPSGRSLLLGGRRLPDERPGARDGGANVAPDPRDRGQQRHVRDDPNAPGTAVTRAASWHRPRQPRFRRVRPRFGAFGERVAEPRTSPTPRAGARGRWPAVIELVSTPRRSPRARR